MVPFGFLVLQGEKNGGLFFLHLVENGLIALRLMYHVCVYCDKRSIRDGHSLKSVPELTVTDILPRNRFVDFSLQNGNVLMVLTVCFSFSVSPGLKKAFSAIVMHACRGDFFSPPGPVLLILYLDDFLNVPTT